MVRHAVWNIRNSKRPWLGYDLIEGGVADGRICAQLSERLQVSSQRAFDIFYRNKTCQLLHDERSMLYLMGDLYIVNDVIRELQKRQDG